MALDSSLRYRLLIAAAATVITGAFHAAPARAADLGGDCCADLEERVAELEATTVRKGNKKVSVELYGDVNKAVLLWNDGHEDKAYVVDNGYKTSRFGIRGKAKIQGEWSAGYRIEVETRVANSRELDQFDDNNDDDAAGQLKTRHSNIYIDSKTYGKLTWGLQESPKDNITKDTHVGGLIVDTVHSDFFMNRAFFVRSKGLPAPASLSSSVNFFDLERCYSTSSSVFDCSTRRNMAVYQTPVWAGFWVNSGYGEDGIWSVSARYKNEWDNWKLGAGVAYEDFRDERVQSGAGGGAGFKRDIKEWGGSGSVLHKGTGLWTHFAWTTSENNDSNTINAGVFTGTSMPEMFSWDLSGGIQKKFYDLGKTTLWGGYTRSEDGIGLGGASREVDPGEFPGINVTTEIVGSQVSKWYLAADQEIERAAMDLYIVYQHITPSADLVDATLATVGAPLDDFDLVYTGARIYF